MFDKIIETHTKLLEAIRNTEATEHDIVMAKDKFNQSVHSAKESHEYELEKAANEANEKAEKLAADVTELKGQVIELENDIKSLNEANEGLREANKEANDENEALKVQVGELESDVETLKEANEKLAEKTGEEHKEVNADPNAKIVTGEKRTATEIWQHNLEKAKQN